jgi:hypothetical protein
MCSDHERNQRPTQRYAEDQEYRERTRAYKRAWHEANKERVNAESRRQWHEDPTRRLKQREYRRKSQRKDQLKYYYGLTVEEYNAILQRQNGVCRMCKRKVEGYLHVDHNHKTGKVRGLLCRTCNIGCGHLRDDADLALVAWAYLKDDGDWITRTSWWDVVRGWFRRFVAWLRFARSPDGGAATDLGFTRDRHLKVRKSGKPDLRARRNPGSPPRVETAPDCASLHPGYKSDLRSPDEARPSRADIYRVRCQVIGPGSIVRPRAWWSRPLRAAFGGGLWPALTTGARGRNWPP